VTAGMAHEINNPLMVLQGSLNIIENRIRKLDLDEKDREKFNKNIEKHSLGIKRITKIIDSVKALSSNTDTVKAEVFSLEDVVSDSLVLFSDKLAANGIRLLKDDMDKTVKLYGVKIQIEQIIMNFISNSIDEIKKKENPWVKISTKRKDNLCFIRITDSGTGIDDLVIRQLFDPFFTTKEVGKGTGLGLSLCKTLAENNGGDIFYELDHGNTSFVLSIPIKS
jgi:C4-dicarboxylate-specific signal transduction histidine kinase